MLMISKSSQMKTLLTYANPSIHFGEDKTKSLLFVSKRKIKKLQKLEIIYQAKKKLLLFPEMRVTTKIFTRVATNFFLNRFSGDILFFFSFFCFLFILVSFCFFVCVFLKLKMYILIQIRLSGRVSGKKVSPGRFLEARLLFLA